MYNNETFEPDLTSERFLVPTHEAVEVRKVGYSAIFSPFLLPLERAISFVLIGNRPEK